MTAPAPFTPSRLTLLREREGLTKEDLASRCGVTRRSVSDWEAGRVARPPVSRVAAALGVAETFLTGPSIDPVRLDGVSFRALTSMTSRQTRRVLATATVATSFVEWLDGRYRTASADLPSLDDLVPTSSESDSAAATAAACLREYWQLTERPVTNLLGLLERHGVRVLSLSSADSSVDAFSYWRSERPYVFVGPWKSAERVRFDMAHELGHLFLHKGVVTSREPRYEHQANAFAAAFLLPAPGLLEHVATAGRQLRLDDVLHLKRAWRVSAVAMVRRLHDLSVVNDWQYRQWMVELSSQGYRRGEPDGLPPESSAFLRDALRLLREDGYTLDSVAATLALSRRDLESCLHGLTLIPVPGEAHGGSGPRPRRRRSHLQEVR